MRVLITGSCGFIGSHLMNYLARYEPRITTVVGMSRRNNIEHRSHNFETNKHVSHLYGNVLDGSHGMCNIIHDVHPDIIFHIAANPNVKHGTDDPDGEDMFVTNVIGTHDVLRHAPDGCRFILASSATVYGDQCQSRSSAAVEDWSASPTSVYGASKTSAEALVEAYTQQGKVRGVSLRYTAVVGPLASHGLVPAIMQKLRSASPTLDLLGNRPGSIKPYAWIDDSVKKTVAVALTECTGTYNIGPVDCMSVEDVVLICMDVLKIHKPITWSGKSWPGDNNFVLVNQQKFSDHFPEFRAECIHSAQAICQTARYYRDH